MSTTHQTKTQTIKEHGELVWLKTKRLISGNWEGMKIPQWFIDNHQWIINNIHHPSIIKHYNLYHDCGKPYCLEIDSEGKRHFPNHAQISKQKWNEVTDDNYPLVGDLIGYDMALHIDTADKIKSYNWDIKTAFTLLVTSLAEIHANADMFGGIDSLSFKMKWKKLDKRGKMLMRMFPSNMKEEHLYSYVFVRNDLSPSQKAVQGTHSTIEQFKSSDIKYHPSVIYLKVKNEYKLKQVMDELLDNEIGFSIFREPDMNNEITSITTEGLCGNRGEGVK